MYKKKNILFGWLIYSICAHSEMRNHLIEKPCSACRTARDGKDYYMCMVQVCGSGWTSTGSGSDLRQENLIRIRASKKNPEPDPIFESNPGLDLNNTT